MSLIFRPWKASTKEFSHRFATLAPTDYAKAQALTDEYEGMKRDLQELYTEWEELAG